MTTYTPGALRKFRKRPVVIEAVRWDGANVDEILGFILAKGSARRGNSHSILIETLEGEMRADKGDWIVRGIKGEYYPVKPDIFAATYEPAENGAASPGLLEALKELTQAFPPREFWVTGEASLDRKRRAEKAHTAALEAIAQAQEGKP